MSQPLSSDQIEQVADALLPRVEERLESLLSRFLKPSGSATPPLPQQPEAELDFELQAPIKPFFSGAPAASSGLHTAAHQRLVLNSVEDIPHCIDNPHRRPVGASKEPQLYDLTGDRRFNLIEKKLGSTSAHFHEVKLLFPAESYLFDLLSVSQDQADQLASDFGAESQHFQNQVVINTALEAILKILQSRDTYICVKAETKGTQREHLTAAFDRHLSQCTQDTLILVPELAAVAADFDKQLALQATKEAVKATKPRQPKPPKNPRPPRPNQPGGDGNPRNPNPRNPRPGNPRRPQPSNQRDQQEPGSTSD